MLISAEPLLTVLDTVTSKICFVDEQKQKWGSEIKFEELRCFKLICLEKRN